MEKTINIHVTYQSVKHIIISKRSNFLKAVAEKFGLQERYIQFISNKPDADESPMSVENMPDFSTVRIVLKIKKKVNRSGESIVLGICKKLKKKKSLTDKERALLCNHLQSLSANLKRKFDVKDTTPLTRNRKLQANPIERKSVYTQTDPLLNCNGNSSKKQHGQLIEIKNVVKTESDTSKKKMDSTFTDRRHWILKGEVEIVKLRKQFPELFSLSEIRNELDRILSEGTGNRFLRNIEKYAERILSMAKHLNDPVLLMLKERNRYISFQKKYAEEVGSILLLMSLLNEPRSFLKLEDTIVSVGSFPYIKCDAKLIEIFENNYAYKVYAENILICEPTNFKEAILCLMACYFIFNIEYAEKVGNTLIVMEKLYLEANDTPLEEVDKTAKQLINEIIAGPKARK